MTITAIIELFDRYLKGEHRDPVTRTVRFEYMALAASLASLWEKSCQK